MCTLVFSSPYLLTVVSPLDIMSWPKELLAFIDVWSGLCPVVLLVSVAVPFASLSLFLLQVCMYPVALDLFLWITVFCIYPGLICIVGKMQCL